MPTIEVDKTPLLLFNTTSRQLHGVYVASSPAALNIDAAAFAGKQPVQVLPRLTPLPASPSQPSARSPLSTSVPLQVRVRLVMEFPALSEAQFAPILQRDPSEPGAYQLDIDEVQSGKLMEKWLVPQSQQ
jgi:hypothetical protein